MTTRIVLPQLLLHQGRFVAQHALFIEKGRVARIAPAPDDLPEGAVVERLPGKAVLPGMVNAHSHAFQRAIRGRTEFRAAGHATDDFWTWREQMYQAAMALSPEMLFAVSRMCFLEMAQAGFTTVGEFHYLHHAPTGQPYADVNELAHHVIAAAREVGLRIGLLRVAYARAGFQKPENPRQARFIDPDVDATLRSIDALRARYANDETWVGVAPHSVRAVPRPWLESLGAYATAHHLPLHMHLSEQPREVVECEAEHGCRPGELVHRLKLLGPRFTAVHAIHLDPQEKTLLGATRSTVCACPTTERNLGDGIIDPSFTQVALGTDSQVQIDAFEEARELEYHLRLKQLERAVLAPRDGDRSALARRLHGAATVGGGKSLGLPGGGTLDVGAPADFVTVDLDDTSIAGSHPDDLLTAIVFSMARTALCDVAVGGEFILRDGRHPKQTEIVRAFQQAQKQLWG